VSRRLLPMLLIAVACNDANFSEDSTVKKTEKEPDKQVAEAKAEPEPEDEKKFDVPSDCTADGITHAKLLTTSIRNNSTDYIEYEIFVTDCEGKIKNVQADTILFDVNASSPPDANAPVLFEVLTNAKSPVTSGVMQTIVGSDLFGVTKPTYRHYKTDQIVEFSVPSSSFIFRVRPPNGRLLANQNMLNPAMRDADQSIETFLRFGNASPVTAVVLFTNY